VLAHTGAERLAAELVRAGADASSARATRRRCSAWSTPTGPRPRCWPPSSAASVPRPAPTAAASTRHGPARPRAFERRIGTLGDADEIPRVAYLKVVSEKWTVRYPDAVVASSAVGWPPCWPTWPPPPAPRLYATGHRPSSGLIGPVLSPHDMERLGGRLVATAASFRDRGLPLRWSSGTPARSRPTTAEELLDLARRAVEVAAVDGTRQVLGAEDLALGVSVTTELEAVVRLLDQVEPACGKAGATGNGSATHRRGARPPARLLPRRGRPHPARRPPPRRRPGRLPPRRSAVPRRAHRRAARGVADLPRLRSADGPLPARALQLTSPAIPEGARIIAVVHRLDLELAGDRHVATSALTELLRAGAGTEFDPDVAATATEHLAELLEARR
jgi:hypothetical protein